MSTIEELHKETKPAHRLLVEDIKDAIDHRSENGFYTPLEVIGALVIVLLDEYACACADSDDDN